MGQLPCKRQELMRAKRMTAQRYFEHEDPKTGKNPVWKTVSQCIPAKRRGSKVPAGENLTKGVDTPENIHKATDEKPHPQEKHPGPAFQPYGGGGVMIRYVWSCSPGLAGQIASFCLNPPFANTYI